MTKKYKNILLYLFMVIIVSVFTKEAVLALSSNYSKSDGSSLSTAEWNNLPNDFVAKSGDTMSGSLDMGNKSIINMANPINDKDAVNKSSMDSAISSAIATINDNSANIKNINGDGLKMVCGSTPIGSTPWLTGNPDSITTQVDASAAGFVSNDVVYFVSLYGSGGIYIAVGVNGIYPPNSGNLRDGFRVYITNNDSSQPNPSNATNLWNWHLRWCGIGL